MKFGDGDPIVARARQFGVPPFDCLLAETRCNRCARGAFLSVTESGVVLGSRTAAVVVSQLNRYRCADRTRGGNKDRADRDTVAE